jgi:hypothetical protein
MSAMSEPDANTTASEGGADAPTGIHEPAAAPDIAMAYSEALELAEPRRWRLPAVAFAVATAALAAAGTGWFLLRPNAPDVGPVAASPAPNTSTTAVPGDQDQYVSVAISPRTRSAGYGTAGTQERADKIAVAECVGASGPDDVCLVIARMHHGCAAIALGDAGTWAGGSGIDELSAKMQALDKLSAPNGVVVRCST